MSSVLLGRRLYYSSAVEKSFTSDQEEISTKLKLEYNALLVKESAEAEVEWNKVGKKWTENRVTAVNTIGGDSSPLDAVAPGFGDNYADTFKAWRQHPLVVRSVGASDTGLHLTAVKWPGRFPPLNDCLLQRPIYTLT